MPRLTPLLLTLSMLIPGSGTIAATRKQPNGATNQLATKSRPLLKTPFESLVAAEVAFAKMSADRGVRAAFLANLATDAVIFRPLPVNGMESYRARPVTTAKLAWGPSYAEVSASGDFGVTTGPWEWMPPAEQQNADMAYGDFLSIWRRESGKSWKAALDCGVSHAKLAAGVGEIPVTAGPLHVASEAPSDSASTETAPALDRSFADAVRATNPSRAVVAWTTDDLRYLRDGDDPRTGDDARNALSQTPAHAAWTPMGGAMARSGDLGFSYGVREDSSAAGRAPDSTVYVHVWRHTDDRHWKMSAVVDTPIKRE